MSGIVAILFMLLAHQQAGAEKVGFVSDPQKCEAQWEIRLRSHRQIYPESEGWPEQLILDANKAGDFKMAQRYMQQHGWSAAATESLNDLTLYFMPDTTPVASARPYLVRRPTAKVAEGLMRACYAAWISGVPFVRVTKRGEDGEGVLYSVTTENMPVRDF